jgi:Raf kinase inhibitor-like YbhB/YbcL family protein
MKLRSTAFEAGETIPEQFTCEGKDISPPLMWNDVPQGTQSLVLICDDPDSSNKVWSHWVLYNIPADQRQLMEGIEPVGELPGGMVQGRNDFGQFGYGGPCPTIGETHRYYWRLYALDVPCDLGPGATRAQIFDWMEGHKLDSSELMARFARS